MTSVLQNIIWPAIAGNVFWALCTILIKEHDFQDDTFRIRLCVLLLIGLYLIAQWLDTQNRITKSGEKIELPSAYVACDVALALLIAALAISTEAAGSALHLQSNVATVILILIYAVCALGHFSDSWRLNGDSGQRNILMGASHALAFAFLSASVLVLDSRFSLDMVLSLLVVTIAWAIGVSCFRPTSKSKSGCDGPAPAPPP